MSTVKFVKTIVGGQVRVRPPICKFCERYIEANLPGCCGCYQRPWWPNPCK